MTSSKSCWCILIIFTIFKEKAEIFNNFFTKERSLINANSDFPSVLSKKTHKSLSTIYFTSDDILKIIRNLKVACVVNLKLVFTE